MKRQRYATVTDGEWYVVAKRKQRVMCCDCGLVHEHDFRKTETGDVEMRSTVNARATAAARRASGFKVLVIKESSE